MIKKVFFGAIAILLFAAGFWVSKQIFQKRQQQIVEAQATVLLEKVEKVFKLVTVEGNFSEIYDEKSFKEYTVFLPLPSTFRFPKTATMQVTGKVLVGFDMDDINITIDSTDKTIVLDNLPTAAEILAIDHTISYKNLDDSFFNSFKPQDYTSLNENAKEVLRQKALESRLMTDAEEQGNQVLEVVNIMAETAGWKVVYISAGKKTPINQFLD